VRIDVTSEAGGLTKAQRERIKRRVLLALSRFERDVRHVRGRLSRSQNPLGGVDVLCSLRASLSWGSLLEAEAIDDEMGAAVSRAASRLALRTVAALEARDPRRRG
jgi:ribosome-associated translation inhibitor RaiA